jgi:hypothetical protein
VPEASRAEAPEGFSLTTIGSLASLVADIAQEGVQAGARDGTPALRRIGRQDAK